MAKAPARLPRPDADPWRQAHNQAAAREGASCAKSLRLLTRWHMARAKPDRLTRNSDFDAVFQHGKSFAGRHAVVVALARPDEPTRVGFVVSTKVGNAPVRNRIKRRLREVWRELAAQVGSPADIVLIGRAPAARCPFEEIKQSVRDALADAGLLQPTSP